MAHKLPLKDIQFLTEFHAFALSKGDEEYDRFNAGQCALAQFGWQEIFEHDCEDCGVPYAAYQAAVQLGEDVETTTFSDLAARLEALLADAPAVVSA